ncbi:MAG: nucleoside triphosphate pyrophosphohydrolase [Gammaproteobacteria bacterium]|nr:nucleoside triphosphate pyrophosphohydrolase [Gammaproteobacteria bacterium]MDH5799386.1 nucleoside triphosphate pyrophosphohydrolase [Gammaproteobacteria bacterium]
MSSIDALIQLMQELRDPVNGCPWDLQQDFHTIAPYTIEEAYEVADAIEREQPQELCEELGDLLFQVVFHSHLAQERGWFQFSDVVAGICQKLVIRHPHVFGTDVKKSAQEQSVDWEKYKSHERQAKNYTSEMDGVAASLPGLLRAIKLQQRAARLGFDWKDVAGVLEKIEEEMVEIRSALEIKDPNQISEEVGDLLFSVVNLARHVQADAETVMRQANQKFERRFRRMEQMLEAQGKTIHTMAIKDLNAIWDAVKSEENRNQAVK